MSDPRIDNLIAADQAAAYERDLAARVSEYAKRRSVHVLDLTPSPIVEPKRKLPAKWRRMLDERIHLHDLRVRSVSVRQRGWKDFPPAAAKGLFEAAHLTIDRFVHEHPLAELTVVALFHTVAVLAWRLVIHPIDLAVRALTGRSGEALIAPISFPLIPSVEVAPAEKEVDANVREVKEAIRLPKPRIAFARPHGWAASVVGFAVLALLVTLPFQAYNSLDAIEATKDATIARSLAAVNAIRDAGSFVAAKDFGGANASFASAERDFESAKQELGAIGTLLTAVGAIAPNSVFSNAKNLLLAGEEIAKGGERVSAGLAALDETMPPSERIRLLNTHLGSALPHLETAALAIDRTSTRGIPARYQSAVLTAKEEFPSLIASLREATEVAGFLSGLLGADEPRRYLLVFQNDTELRPTGGFVGSFALLDVHRGEITRLDIPGGGSYDLQGQLRADLVAPQPLRLINPRWEFQDANWSPDFPTSAKRLAWFYEQADGPSVDGVIAVNADVMAALLGVVGEVHMEEYDVAVNAENFIPATQNEVENEYDKDENRPKQFIADLAPEVLDRIFTADKATFLDLVGVLNAALATKDVQMWFDDADMQKRADEFGWTGRTKDVPGDYLQIVHTNIAGQKTDGKMRERVTHEAKILPDGETVVTLTIERTHTGVAGEEFTGARNVDWLRVYVPKGSELVEATGDFETPAANLFSLPEPGFTTDPVIAAQEETTRTDRASGTRIMTDLGKTVFANWVQTDPGETSVVTFTYRLPAGTVAPKTKDETLLQSVSGGSAGTMMAYSLLVQKQSGSTPTEFISQVDLPRTYAAIWTSDGRTADDHGTLVHETFMDRDAFFGIVAESY
jgi:hypothetical protein